MTLQEQYDEAMFDYTQGEYARAVVKLKAVLAQDPGHFDAQLALSMAYCRLEDYPAAIAEGLKAEKLRPQEQLVYTNLSLFYMKSGNKVIAEKYGLQAKVEGWRDEAKQIRERKAAAAAGAVTPAAEPELQLSKSTPVPMKFPSQPWKKKKVDSPEVIVDSNGNPKPQDPESKS
jgi:Flp pilus assembly protein TadD